MRTNFRFLKSGGETVKNTTSMAVMAIIVGALVGGTVSFLLTMLLTPILM